MKRILAAFGLLILFAGYAFSDQRTTGGTSYNVAMQWVPITPTLIADSGTVSAVIDTALADLDIGSRPIDYWKDARIVINDRSSSLLDSTRHFKEFIDPEDSASFEDTLSTALAAGDSFYVVVPVTNEGLQIPLGWGIEDSASVDTSETFLMTPGASITSAHLIVQADSADSVDTKIVLEIALDEALGTHAGWFRVDSITYASQDTTVYKAWGAKQASMFRFIFDAVDAKFTKDPNTVTMYNQVLTDK